MRSGLESRRLSKQAGLPCPAAWEPPRLAIVGRISISARVRRVWRQRPARATIETRANAPYYCVTSVKQYWAWHHCQTWWEDAMDLVYVLLTLLFFGLSYGFVKLCEKL